MSTRNERVLTEEGRRALVRAEKITRALIQDGQEVIIPEYAQERGGASNLDQTDLVHGDRTELHSNRPRD